MTGDFERRVAPRAHQVLASDAEVARLGLAPREVSVFFSDIQGFTALSERLSHEALIKVLAEYLEEMSGSIEASRGTVGKYIGDAIMVGSRAGSEQGGESA